MSSGGSTGVYCLANDAVLDWFRPFLESLRRHDPMRRLVVIPYDDRISELERLSRQNGVELMGDATLGELDRLGGGRFRKLAAFWGPLDRFLFLDADTVVLGALDHLFAVLDDAGAELLHTDADPDTGAFASRRGLVTLDDVRGLVPELAHGPIGHCCDRRGDGLLRFQEASPGLASSCWAGAGPAHRSPYCASYCDKEGRWVPFLHWAGFDRGPDMPNADVGLDGGLATDGARTRIAHTPHGLGLVAATQLAAGAVVALWDGFEVPYEAVPEHEVVYVLQWGTDRFIIPRTEARFVNHGCDPNCAIDRELQIVTIAPVQAGEELVYDYVRTTRADAPEAFWDERWTFECSCGSPRCLGLIDGPVIVDG
jgi:hypothetical protein